MLFLEKVVGNITNSNMESYISFASNFNGSRRMEDTRGYARRVANVLQKASLHFMEGEKELKRLNKCMDLVRELFGVVRGRGRGWKRE